MKKTIVITLCLCALITLVSCNNTYETPARVSEPAPESTVSAQDDVSAEASEASPEVSRAGETFADGWKALDDFCREFHTDIVDIFELEYGSGERDFIYWMIDNEIDEWSNAHRQLAGTGAEMRAHAYECCANWKREVLETLDELSGLLPDDLYTQLKDLTERRIAAIEEATLFSARFRQWEYGWSGSLGSMWPADESNQQAYGFRSLCAELKVYELWAYYTEENGRGGYVPDDISDFKEKFPVTFENTSEFFKD